MELACSQQTFEKSSNIKFHEKSVQWDPSCSIRGSTKTPIVDFRNSANAPKSLSHLLES